MGHYRCKTNRKKTRNATAVHKANALRRKQEKHSCSDFTQITEPQQNVNSENFRTEANHLTVEESELTVNREEEEQETDEVEQAEEEEEEEEEKDDESPILPIARKSVRQHTQHTKQWISSYKEAPTPKQTVFDRFIVLV